MEKTIMIDGKAVAFKATAAVPRLYRIKFKRDIIQDLSALKDKYIKDEAFSVPDLETFENATYIMAKHADPNIPPSPEEWLEQFETFSIYQVLPEVIGLWVDNEASLAESKKKINQLTVR
jgi:hypothetical protein